MNWQVQLILKNFQVHLCEVRLVVVRLTMEARSKTRADEFQTGPSMVAKAIVQAIQEHVVRIRTSLLRMLGVQWPVAWAALDLCRVQATLRLPRAFISIYNNLYGLAIRA